MGLQLVKLLDPLNPTIITGGLVPRGAYNAGTDYAVGDSVDYNGSSYVMFNNAVAGTLPTDTTYWQVVANKGDQGERGEPTTIVAGDNIIVDATDPENQIVSLDENPTNINSLNFDTTPTVPIYAEGNIYWDELDKTLNIQQGIDDVVLQVGQELYIRSRNSTGSTITNGKVVYISGATGNRPNITLAQANSPITSNVIGMVTHDIENNSDGLVTVIGKINDLDTSAYTEGDMLYLSASTAGDVTNVEPSSPNQIVRIGTVLRANPANGTILFKAENVPRLSDYELLSNKSTTTTLGTSNTLYPTQNAVKTYVDTGLATKATLLNVPQFSVPYRNTSGSGEPNTSLAVRDSSAVAYSLAARTATGALFAATPTDPAHAATKAYVDTADALKANVTDLAGYVLKAGDTMTGNLNTTGLAVQAAVGAISITSQSANAFSNGLTVNKRGSTGDAGGAVLSNSEIGYHTFSGWTGAAYKRLAYVIVKAEGDTTPTTGGGTYSIVTRDSGNVEAQRLFINSTGMSLGITSPTHTLTLPSTATGIALYNTTDQTTNYERVRQYWSGNVYNIATEMAGTGQTRNMRLVNNNTSITLADVTSPKMVFANVGGTGTGSVYEVQTTLSSPSAIQRVWSILPTINQSGTAGYTALLINPTETSTGSGPKNLIDAQVGGVSRFKVSNTGATSIIDGTQGTGKVLTSDASGNASWQAPSGGGSGITRSIVTTSGNVTAGATASTDYVYIIAGAHTVTLPTAVGNTNKYDLNNASGSPVSLAFTSGQTANGGGVTLGVNESITLISDDANWRIL